MWGGCRLLGDTDLLMLKRTKHFSKENYCYPLLLNIPLYAVLFGFFGKIVLSIRKAT